MSGDLTVTIRGLESFSIFDNIVKNAPRAAQRAVNRAADKARTRSSKDLRTQVAFKARDLISASGKIELRSATPSSLTAVLSASSNARSLARFARPQASRKKGVKVEVQPGSTQFMPGAFLLGIPTGNDEGVNTILAVRSPGKPRSAYRPRRIGNGLWSLYGPNVAQALLNAEQKGIWPDMEAEIIANLETEFLRQIDLDSKP